MSEVGKLRPVIQTVPVRPINKEPDKKKQQKKEEGKELPQQEDENSNEHVDEFI